MMTEQHDTVVIGAGQAGLAMSYWLSAAGTDHVVLERGRTAERWISERWDSLRLLTPNWMTRLPGLEASFDDPHGFMSRDELVDLLGAYAESFGAPIRHGVTVTSVGHREDGFEVGFEGGSILAKNVVIATGHCGRPLVPEFALRLHPAIHQLHASRYRRPADLPPGGVLVVGAGASGLQIADELASSGRTVVLASGRHARAVRRYRYRDLWWWLDLIGSLDETVDDVANVEAARNTPSLGLTGWDGGRDIDLGTLARVGVTVAGRVVDLSGRMAVFGTNLAADMARSEKRLRALLDRFDAAALERGRDAELGHPSRPMPIRLSEHLEGPRSLDGIGTVVWATGYRRSYPWLRIGNVLDGGGELVHRRGVTPVDGLYVLGLRFQWTRGSHFIDGVGEDARFLAEHILDRSLQPAA
jgi:putative flavoprotein involved in K+ transport